MGKIFAAPSEFNPAGFYEERPVCELNDEIMEDCGMKGFEGWPERSTVLKTAASYRGRMDEIVRASSADGWKDPRFCVTLESWLPRLPALPKVVVCLRSPEAFLHSVISIYGLLSRERMESWWANHLRRMLTMIDEYRLDATCVVYEELVQRPKETAAALSAFVERPLDASYVEPSLQQHSQEVPERHAALFAQVRALADR